jgi:SAM-dependent methyltransferase
MATINPLAQTGFASAAAYDAYRPSFPPEAVDELLKHLEVHGVEGARIADLAAGTGKFTEILSARPEKYEVVAIEPHDDMRAQLEQKKLRGVTVVNGAAEDMSKLDDGKFAAVIAAQVRHSWNASDFSDFDFLVISLVSDEADHMTIDLIR